jgi:hypothetical protein
MTENNDWIKELGREWTGRQQEADGEKRRRVDEERPRREAREHFWADFRAAVEQIVRDFNTAVGQSLVDLSPGQKNVSSLGLKAGSTHLRAAIGSDSKLRIEQPGRLGVPGKRVFGLVYVDGRIDIADLPASADAVARHFLEPWLQSVVRGRPGARVTGSSPTPRRGVSVGLSAAESEDPRADS